MRENPYQSPEVEESRERVSLSRPLLFLVFGVLFWIAGVGAGIAGSVNAAELLLWASGASSAVWALCSVFNFK